MTIWKREFIPQKSPMQKSSILRTQGFCLVISSRVLFEQNTSLGGCIIFKANPIPWSKLFWLLAGLCTFFLSFGKWARCKMTLNRSVYPQWARTKPEQTWCLTPWPLGVFKYNFRQVIFKLTLVNGGWGISYEIALRWMPLDLTDDNSTLVQAMAWCRQAASHYMSQCWSRSMSPNGITMPRDAGSFLVHGIVGFVSNICESNSLVWTYHNALLLKVAANICNIVWIALISDIICWGKGIST